jgi:hypothetical protein
MFRIRTLFAAIFAFLATVAALAANSPLAHAQLAPDGPGESAIGQTAVTAPTEAMTHSSSVWAFVLVAALSAIVTVAITLLAVQRLRRSPRPLTA